MHYYLIKITYEPSVGIDIRNQSFITYHTYSAAQNAVVLLIAIF